MDFWERGFVSWLNFHQDKQSNGDRIDLRNSQWNDFGRLNIDDTKVRIRDDYVAGDHGVGWKCCDRDDQCFCFVEWAYVEYDVLLQSDR